MSCLCCNIKTSILNKGVIILLRILFIIGQILIGPVYYVKCNDCGKVDIPRREVSVLNLIFYVIVGIIAYFILEKFNLEGWSIIISVLLIIAMAFTNVRFAKPKCKHCGSLEIEVTNPPQKDTPEANESTIENKTQQIESISEQK